MKIIKSVLLVLFLINFFISTSQNVLRKIERAILNGDKESAVNELKKIRKDSNYNLLRRVVYKKATYDDYFNFVSGLELSGKSQHERFCEFVKRIKQPTSKEKVDIDYVKLKWVLINDLRNDVSLKRAT